MANYCSNSVVFTADEQTLQNIRDLFTEIEQNQLQHEKYYLPSFVTQEDGYMQDIVVDPQRITFETRWVPNTEVLLQIADFYKAGFTCKYQEMAMGIYGECRYDGQTLLMVNLDSEDFKAIRYDKQKKGYLCGQDVFEFEGDLLDHMIEQKFQNNKDIEITIQRS